MSDEKLTGRHVVGEKNYEGPLSCGCNPPSGYREFEKLYAEREANCEILVKNVYRCEHGRILTMVRVETAYKRGSFQLLSEEQEREIMGYVEYFCEKFKGHR